MDSSVPQNTPRARLPMGVALATVAGLAFALVVASQQLPLWVPGQMVYGFRQPVAWGAMLPLLAIVAAQWWAFVRLRGAAMGGRKRREVAWLGALCALALALNLGLRAGETAGLARISILTLNPAAGGYYYAGFDSRDQSDWLAQYPQLMRDHHHVATHPPGGVWLMRFWRQRAEVSPLMQPISDDTLALSLGVRNQDIAAFAGNIWKRAYQPVDIAASWWAGVWFMVAASLIPAAVYGAARVSFGASAAACAALLAAWAPSFSTLSPAFDALTALVAALVWLACALGLKRDKIAWFFAAGLVAGLGFLLSFVLVAVLLMAGGFVLWRHLQNGGTAKRFALYALAVTGGTLIVIAISGWWGVQWLEIYRVTHQLQAETMLQYNRQYQTWIWFNLIDFFSFCGLPLVVMLGVVLARSARQTPEGKSWRALWPVVIPTLAVILAVNFGANVLAESARIWMPFVPPLAITAGVAVARLADEWKWTIPLVLGAQLVQMLVMAASLNVWSF